MLIRPSSVPSALDMCLPLEEHTIDVGQPGARLLCAANVSVACRSASVSHLMLLHGKIPQRRPLDHFFQYPVTQHRTFASFVVNDRSWQLLCPRCSRLRKVARKWECLKFILHAYSYSLNNLSPWSRIRPERTSDGFARMSSPIRFHIRFCEALVAAVLNTRAKDSITLSDA